MLIYLINLKREPNIAGVITFKAALDFAENIGLDNISKHEEYLLQYCIQKLSKIPE